MALRVSNVIGKTTLISSQSRRPKLFFDASSKFQRRPIMTSAARMEKALEQLKNNPYFEKYAKNIAKLQETSPEELLSRMKERETKVADQKEKRELEMKFQRKCAAKPIVDGSSGAKKKSSLSDVMKLELIEDKVAKSYDWPVSKRFSRFRDTTWKSGRYAGFPGTNRQMTARFYGEYGERKKVFYASTPIFYVNAGPHIGHLYSAVLADTMTRYHSMLGYETILTTGTDEHGNKVENAAKAAKLPVEEYCRGISSEFRKMCDQFDVRYTHFIRTTDEKHRDAVRHFWNTLKNNDNIYLGKYKGWYCVPDEAFLPAAELIETKNSSGETIRLSAESGHPVEWTEEENYKFRLSAFQDDLKYWLRNAKTVRPAKFHKILSDWIEDGSCLEDLSVSRPAKRVPWGISVPNDETHTIYVWLDALVNYLTSVGYPNEKLTNEYWPPTMQVIGKDILKFHGIFWPAFLIAAGLEPPRTILCHSHWTVDDEKMSKSKGNVISPFLAADELTKDGLRYFLLREAVPHSDANYSDTKVRRILNSELADTFGNLVSRCMGKSINPTGEIVDPSLHVDTLKSESANQLIEILERLSDEAKARYDELNLHHAVDETMNALRAANRMVEHHKPWQLRKEYNSGNAESGAQLQGVLSLALETCRISALVLLPIVPNLCSNLLDYLRVPNNQRSWDNTKFSCGPDSRQSVENSSAIVFRRIKT